jgi:hypothetical protein
MPPAKVTKLTERLLVMMALVAMGATLTTDLVHISWRSMVAIISGPTKWRMNSGRALVSAAPSRPQATETSKRGQHIADLALEDGRILVAQKAEEGEQIGLAAGIDDMVSASQQLIHMLRRRCGRSSPGAAPRGLRPPGGRAGPSPATPRGRAAQAARVGLGQQSRTAGPSRAAA